MKKKLENKKKKKNGLSYNLSIFYVNFFDFEFNLFNECMDSI